MIKLKRLFFILLSLLNLSYKGQTQNIKRHNYIDDIRNIKQIDSLLKSLGKYYSDFRISEKLKYTDKDCQKFCDSLKVKPFTKADFDNNGYTDLLLIGEQSGSPAVLCLLDSGKNNISINRLTRRIFQNCSFPIIEKTNRGIFINYFYFNEQDWRTTNQPRAIQSKKLIYKFGDFIEYNAEPQDYHIQKIEYATTSCFGTCPVFTIVINSDRTAQYNAFQYNKPDGKFKGIIDQQSYSELIDLLDYMDFANLESNYNVNWTDDQTCTLTITYSNGKTKTIRDYGLIGTYGLDRTYDLLFKLRENQKWK